ncbi:cytochrome P450 [Irpex lacteus]|nr:cytochrome P450 [Irpex lacteus]
MASRTVNTQLHKVVRYKVICTILIGNVCYVLALARTNRLIRSLIMNSALHRAIDRNSTSNPHGQARQYGTASSDPWVIAGLALFSLQCPPWLEAFIRTGRTTGTYGDVQAMRRLYKNKLLLIYWYLVFRRSQPIQRMMSRYATDESVTPRIATIIEKRHLDIYLHVFASLNTSLPSEATRFPGFFIHTIMSTEQPVPPVSYLTTLITHPSPLKYPLFIVLVVLVARALISSFRNRNTFPGPPGLPLIGNVHQIPSGLQFQKYREWAEKYGPIFSMKLFGQRVLVLDTFKAASDLFDHCSYVYDGRPRLTMTNEIITGGLMMALIGYGDLLRRYRRATHDAFNVRAVENYQSFQKQAAALAVLQTVSNPKNWWHNIEISIASPIFRLLCGFLPRMKYIPAWLAPWKRQGLARYEEETRYYKHLFEDACEQSGSDGPRSFATHLLENEHRCNFTKEESAWLCAMMIFGGMETTHTAMTWFILAMLHYPHVMRKAQAELDAVVGRDRAPNFKDEERLPYITALVKETLRWHPPSPLGMSHRALEDNWFRGHLIPKDTIVIGNIWSMNKDPEIFPDYDVFRPERYLEDNEKVGGALGDTHQMGHAAFGFGRRICPGMFFADQGLFIAIATLLWAFDLRPPLDKQGKEVLPPTDKWIDIGLIVRPEPYDCRFIPRFPEVQDIMEAEAGYA